MRRDILKIVKMAVVGFVVGVILSGCAALTPVVKPTLCIGVDIGRPALLCMPTDEWQKQGLPIVPSAPKEPTNGRPMA